LNEWLNGYELRFRSGLSPNGSDMRLLGQILANRLVERVHTRRLDRPVAAGALGLGWAGSKAELAGLARLGRTKIGKWEGKRKSWLGRAQLPAWFWPIAK
jgi:hypothetical protein